MQVPRIRRKLAMLKHLDAQGRRATGKISNKTKKCSLDSLERLGVSPNAQEIFCRETGQGIPSSVEDVSIQRPKGIFDLVRGQLVRRTSVGRGLLQHNRRNRRSNR